MRKGRKRCFLMDYIGSRGEEIDRILLYAFLIFTFTLFIIVPFHAKTLKVGIAQNKPKVYWDEQGNPSGIFVDILDYIAEQEDWEIEYQKATWDENLQLLESNQLDLVADVAFTTDRDKIYEFHQIPVLFSWTQIFARKGFQISRLEDLNGLRVAALKNSVQASLLQEMGKGLHLDITVVTATSFDEVLALVRDNKADAAATNYHFGKLNARRYNLEETDILFEPSSLHFAAPKGRHIDILKTIDKHLADQKRRPDTQYYRILKKHTSEELEHGIPIWLIWGSLALISVTILLLVTVIIFRHQVHKRTAELKRANQDMEKRIEERTEELSLAMHKAQVADMLNSAFLATMSHELRTPLNSVIGFTGILLRQMPGPLNDEQNKMLSIVQNSARHLLSLINDVLDISKIEAGELELHMKEIELIPIIEDVFALINPQAEEKGLELNLRVSDHPRFIIVDERRFEQVLINLMGNAVKFTFQGKITLSYYAENNFLILRIEDTGIGIPNEMLSKLFQPFMQVDMGIDRKFEGTGLGLFISRKIIEMMGGSIEVQSEPDKGSCFTIKLPLSPQETPCENESC